MNDAEHMKRDRRIAAERGEVVRLGSALNHQRNWSTRTNGEDAPVRHYVTVRLTVESDRAPEQVRAELLAWLRDDARMGGAYGSLWPVLLPTTRGEQ